VSDAPKFFLARQPIFNWEQSVYAYELLYRGGPGDTTSGNLNDLAKSREMIDNLLVSGIKPITNGRLAFINATRETLIERHATMLPPEETVVEILETVAPDDDVLSACRDLRNDGYLVALDDFTGEESMMPWLDHVDFVKVDFLGTTPAAQSAIIERHQRDDLAFLAEKVETRADFERAMDLGYDYFQGFFFAKPAMVSERSVETISSHLFQLLKEVNSPQMDFDRIEMLFKSDVGFTFRLLRYINSAFFGLRSEVTSIRQALALLGERELRKWITLLALTRLAADQPSEVFTQAIVRARFSEELARRAGHKALTQKCFIAGMFSLIDTMLGMDLKEILAELPVDDEIRAALLGQKNLLRRHFDCALPFESGDWQELDTAATDLDIAAPIAAEVYRDAMKWTDDLMGMTRSMDEEG
jgi:EAL and modified HD-GYP domain-containing signal transduction protein